MSKIAQIIIAFILVCLILLQSKGGGLSQAVSGAFTFYRSKRGVERLLFIITIAMIVIFVANSVLLILLFS